MAAAAHRPNCQPGTSCPAPGMRQSRESQGESGHKLRFSKDLRRDLRSTNFCRKRPSYHFPQIIQVENRLASAGQHTSGTRLAADGRRVSVSIRRVAAEEIRIVVGNPRMCSARLPARTVKHLAIGTCLGAWLWGTAPGVAGLIGGLSALLRWDSRQKCDVELQCPERDGPEMPIVGNKSDRRAKGRPRNRRSLGVTR